jgi:cysteine desulfurase/selenocysteine lyase
MENVRKHEVQLNKKAAECLRIGGLRVYGPSDPEKKSGVFSFNMGDVHSHDLADVINSDGIAVRSGHHCAQPLMKRLGVPAATRASFYIYNTEEEVERLGESLKKAKGVFRL